MTKLSAVDFRGKFFWVYDVVGGVFLWHLVDATKKHFDGKKVIWLDECVEKWQVAAAINVCAFYADDDWTEEQINLVISLSRLAVSEIRSHGDFTGEEVRSLDLAEGLEIHPRGMKVIPSEPIARFGEAIIALLLNEHPAPPAFSTWLYSVEEEPEVCEITTNWDTPL
jgi:hypothetical protein